VAEGNSLEQLGLVDVPRRNGHAMEFRLYAEDPQNNFMPAPGRLIYFVPAQVEGVRYDSGVESGSEISMYYDPMIAKVIAYGETRHHCLQRMLQALKKTVIVGLTTNQQFLLKLLETPDFVRGDFDTHFIQNHPELVVENIPDVIHYSIATAATLFLWNLNRQSQILHRHVSPGFRNVFYRNEYKEFKIDNKDFRVEYRSHPRTHAETKDLHRETFSFTFSILGNSFPVSLETNQKNSQITKNSRTGHYSGFVHCNINGHRRSFFIFHVTEKNELHCQADSLQRPFVAFLQPKLKLSSGSSQSSELYRASMAGKIVSVLVKEGESVNEGDVLLIIESMKMETKILSLHTGVVSQVFVVAGQLVEDGQSLVLFKEENNQ